MVRHDMIWLSKMSYHEFLYEHRVLINYWIYQGNLKIKAIRRH